MDRSGGGGRPPNPYHAALRGLRRGLAAAALFSALINVLMLTGSIYMLQVYDRVLGSGSVPTLVGLFAIVVVLYGFLWGYDALRSRILARLAMRLDLALAPRAFEGLFADGPLVSPRPLRDIETLRGFLASPAVPAVLDIPWVPLFLGVLFVIHPWLGGLTLAGALVGALMALATRLLTEAPIARAAAIEAEERDFADQARAAAETVRAMGMAERITAAWRRRHVAGLAMQQAAGDPADLLGPASRTFRMLLQSAILTLGAYLVLRHEITAGMIVASSILSGRALQPVDQVIGQWRVFGRAAEAHRRLGESFAAAAPVPPPLRLPPPTGRLVLDRITKFAPGSAAAAAGDRPRLLHQISLALEPGDGLGVIGASASGKSVLARILVGAWTPDAGELRLDGATRAQWAPQELGRWTGYLPQQVRMLPGTIAQNIARFDPEAEDAAVIAAARLTGVHEMILALPEGYATRLGGPDEPLSGGQMQRLGLARAVYRMPRLVVLDEPNANLDAAGDEALTLAIRTLREAGSTVVVMAHRPSGIAAVNKILVLQAGRVLSFGDKAEMLRGSLEPPPRALPDPGGPPAAAAPPGAAAASAAASARVTPLAPPPPRPAATGRLQLPERGTSVWPPLPPLPEGAGQEPPPRARPQRRAEA